MNDFKRFVSVALFVGVCSTHTMTAQAQDMPTTQGDYSQTTQLADGTSYGYGLHLPKTPTNVKTCLWLSPCITAGAAKRHHWNMVFSLWNG